MSNAISGLLFEFGIRNAVCMPDSLNSSLIRALNSGAEIKVIQGLNESDVITVSAGLNLAGSLTVAVMENSGIRSVADILTRFELSHNIHNFYLLTDRGGFGEENWWGVAHKNVTNTILKELNILTTSVNSLKDFKNTLENGVKSFRTEQASIAINISQDFYRSLL